MPLFSKLALECRIAIHNLYLESEKGGYIRVMGTVLNKTDLNSEKWTNKLLWILLGFSMILTFYVQYPSLIDKYKTQDDARVHMYWMAKFQDNELFERDFLTERLIREVNLFGRQFFYYPKSIGFSFLCYIPSFFVDPIFFNKILPFILMAICVLYSFKLGTFIKGTTCGLLLSLTFIVFNLNPSEFSVTQGLQRSFAFPLIIPFLYFLIKKHYVKASVLITLGAFIYPIIFATCVLVYTLSVFHDIKNTKEKRTLLKHAIAPLLIAILIGLFLHYPALIKAFPKSSKHNCQEEVAKNILKDDPVFGPMGRRFLFSEGSILGIPKYLISGRGGLLTSSAWGPLGRNVVPLLSFSFFLLLIVGFDALRLNKEIWYVLVSSLIMFGLAWFSVLRLSAFALYFPSRYTSIGLPFFLILFISANFGYAAKRVFLRRNALVLFFSGIVISSVAVLFSPEFIASHFSHDGILEPSTISGLRIMRSIATSLGFIVALSGISIMILSKSTRLNFNPASMHKPLLFLFVLLTIIIYIPGIKSIGVISPSSAERELYQFLSTLPKDSYIAGHPDDMQNIPIFAKRKVFESTEFLYNEKRTFDLFSAYYGNSVEEIEEFCNRYEVDYWVVNRKYFCKEYLSKGRVFFDPFNEFIIEKTKGKGRFVLNDIVENRKLFEVGNLFVVKSDAITEK